MRRKLFRDGIGFSLGFLALLAVASQLENPQLRDENMLAAFDQKEWSARQHDGPIVILTGGSNVAYAMDSQRLSESLDRECYNLSLHAGLGLKFMLDHAASVADRGDCVVIFPEYEHFLGGYHGGRELVALTTDVSPRSATLLDADHRIRMFPDWLIYQSSKLCRRTGLLHNPPTSPAYHRDSFSERGDAVAHWHLDAAPIIDVPLEKDAQSIDANAIAFLQSFVAEAKRRGISCVIMPPVHKRESFENRKPTIEAIAAALEEKDIGFAVPCESYAFPDDNFFDSPYHLLADGVAKRTELVAADLIASMGWQPSLIAKADVRVASSPKRLVSVVSDNDGN